DERIAKHENRLVQEKSPYLLQHAQNPVEWFPWGKEAFEKARREDKPIFLSIGYSTCHWCHVMAHESFEDAATAEIMNREFVNIKVDREERLDVDRVYMTFVQATTGGGGWPMSVWLTPHLEPFVGGTYFPPADRFGQPAFKRVLERIAEAVKKHRERRRLVECTITSAVDFIDIRSTRTGTCSISRKCFTTRRSWRALISTRFKSQASRNSQQPRATFLIMSNAI